MMARDVPLYFFVAYGAWSLLAIVVKLFGGECLPAAGVICSMIK